LERLEDVTKFRVTYQASSKGSILSREKAFRRMTTRRIRSKFLTRKMAISKPFDDIFQLYRRVDAKAYPQTVFTFVQESGQSIAEKRFLSARNFFLLNAELLSKIN
jgi:hypothetical protein